MNNGFALGSVMPPGALPKSNGGQPEVGASADARRNAEAVQATNGVSAPNQKPIGAETAQAIKPTPVVASAVKIEMTSTLSKEEFDQLPITGPDKFAQGVAHMNQKEHEAKQSPDTSLSKDVELTNKGNDGVYEIAERVAEKQQAEGPKEEPRPIRSDDKPIALNEAERAVERQQAEGPKPPERAVGDEGRSAEADKAVEIAKKKAAEGPKEVERGPELRDRPVGEQAA